MKGKEDSSEKKRVVIVGGGVAGALLAKLIQYHADVTLIDPKEYFEIPWANLRSKIQPLIAEKSLIDHATYFTNGRIITSWAKNLTETDVLTAVGDIVSYDYLVVATGHAVKVPRSRRGRLDQFHEENARIQSARSVMIIGGGPTGVELAGEMASVYPEKKISLVHNGPRLLEFIGSRAGSKALHWLQSKNVRVLLDLSVDLESLAEAKGEYTTSAGEKIAADLHFVCVDRAMGSEWLRESFLNNQLTDNGRLMVDDSLRVVGQKNVFAIGDITDIPELKQGYLAQKHAMVAAKNLKVLVKGGKESGLYKYRPLPKVAVVSLGRKNAVMQVPFLTTVGFLPGMFKSGDLFLHKTRRLLGIDRHSRGYVASASSDEASEGSLD